MYQKSILGLLFFAFCFFFAIILVINRDEEVASDLTNIQNQANLTYLPFINEIGIRFPLVGVHDRRYVDKVTYKIPGCNCVRYGVKLSNMKKELHHSTCSDFATQRGVGQKVFTYSFYRPVPANKRRKVALLFKKYLEQMELKMPVIGEHFPGWMVRLYHNVSSKDELEMDFICRMHCRFDYLDLCDVTNLPGFRNLLEKQPIGRLWRFAVMGDPTVDIFLSRDTDSHILMREVSALKEWLVSNKTFHLMRDLPTQFEEILAGLWGGRNSPGLASVRNEMFSYPPSFIKTHDQQLLKKFVWPVIKHDVLQHMSYNCTHELYGKTTPFPTQRQHFLYVGWGNFKEKGSQIVRNNTCPYECRPKQHKDWMYC